MDQHTCIPWQPCHRRPQAVNCAHPHHPHPDPRLLAAPSPDPKSVYCLHASEEESRKGKPPRSKLWQWRRVQREPGGAEEVQGGSSQVCSGLGKLFDSQFVRPSLKVPGNPAIARGWAGPGVAQAPCSSPPTSSPGLGPREASWEGTPEEEIFRGAGRRHTKPFSPPSPHSPPFGHAPPLLGLLFLLLGGES